MPHARRTGRRARCRTGSRAACGRSRAPSTPCRRLNTSAGRRAARAGRQPDLVAAQVLRATLAVPLLVRLVRSRCSPRRRARSGSANCDPSVQCVVRNSFRRAVPQRDTRQPPWPARRRLPCEPTPAQQERDRLRACSCRASRQPSPLKRCRRRTTRLLGGVGVAVGVHQQPEVEASPRDRRARRRPGRPAAARSPSAACSAPSADRDRGRRRTTGSRPARRSGRPIGQLARAASVARATCAPPRRRSMAARSTSTSMPRKVASRLGSTPAMGGFWLAWAALARARSGSGVSSGSLMISSVGRHAVRSHLVGVRLVGRARPAPRTALLEPCRGARGVDGPAARHSRPRRGAVRSS